MIRRAKTKGVINRLHRLAEGITGQFLNHRHLKVKLTVFLTGYIFTTVNYILCHGDDRNVFTNA